ncbi:unnamed protein product [Moneuplotes crassus]|uniref:B box-type domain-containing protein n=1 Tax=Euplotes crassus TaxID=5936 RepID=A0AAD1U224_EUPCR|nr:unnamed protein product [Moneuplotes crassus]
MWSSSQSESAKNAKIYEGSKYITKEHPPIERGGIESKRLCIKHPGRELEFLRKRDGVMVCAICILQESERGEKDIKDKYCVKHPGFEKLFFCKDCVKGICERCISVHSDCDIVTVVLQAQKLTKGFNSFKTDFQRINQDWRTLHEKFSEKKETFYNQVDNTSKDIENHFDELIKKIEESKSKYLEAFKIRAQGEMQDLLDEDEAFNEYYTNVKHKELEIAKLEDLYENSNDYDLVKESSIMKNEEMFKEFVPEYTESLNRCKQKYKEIEEKSGYSFSFETVTKDEEIINTIHKNIKIKMKMEDTQGLDIEESKGEFEEEKHAKGETGHTKNKNYKQLYRIDKIKRRMLNYDLNEKKLRRINYNEPTIKDTNEEIETRKMSTIFRGILSPDSKSICTDSGEIYLFGASETKFSSAFYTMEGNEIEQLKDLPTKRKKISCASTKTHIYFTGEFEGISSTRSILERYDIETREFSEITGLNKQSNYILCVYNARYLVAFPYSINSFKIMVCDLDNLTEISEGVLKGDWKKYTNKNPSNLNLYICYKSSAIQISRNEIFLSSLKYGYVYNMQTQAFTDQKNYAVDDEFYDGFLVKGHYLYAYGAKGLQRFDFEGSKKWYKIGLRDIKEETENNEESNESARSLENQSESASESEF